MPARKRRTTADIPESRSSEFLRAHAKAYRQWRMDPFTQRLYEFARDMCRPTPLTSATSDLALYQYGLQVGYSELLEFLFNLPDAVHKLETATTAAMLDATYEPKRRNEGEEDEV